MKNEESPFEDNESADAEPISLQCAPNAENATTLPLRRLLDSSDKANLALAVELMVTGGVPKSLVSQVLAISLVHPDVNLRKKANAALNADPDSPILDILVANNRNLLTLDYLDLMDRLYRIAKKEAIDGYAFSKMASRINAQYFQPLHMQFMTGEELHRDHERDNSLHFMNKFFPALPRGILELESLDHLQLCMLRLKAVPEGLDRIPGLKGLDLNDNKLRELPDWFANMASLELLRLCTNEFKEIPAVLQRLPRLRELDMSANDLKALPIALAEYPALRDLGLSGCGFKTLPDVLAEIPQLEGLAMSGRGVAWKEIPASISKLTRLKRLSLCSHHFKTVSDALIDLPLEELDFSFCKLSEIPNWLPFITTLRSLNFFYCQDIWRLPHDIGDLVNLEMLNLSGTSVSELPSSFSALQNLKQLYLPEVNFSHPEAALGTLIQLKGLEQVNDLAYPDKVFLRKLHAAMPHVRFGG
jgi:hypothetical protein